jgi:hypothetical protein
MRPTNEFEVVKADLQSRFRSVVSVILCLMKHSRPNIANVIRELAKIIDSATLAAYKEMLKVARFVLDTQLFCLKMEPKKDEEDWNLLVYCVSDKA